MTPIEKAKELVERFLDKQSEILSINNIVAIDSIEMQIAKQCAIIAVDEILDSYIKEKNYGYVLSDKIIPYWQKVKEELL